MQVDQQLTQVNKQMQLVDQQLVQVDQHLMQVDKQLIRVKLTDHILPKRPNLSTYRGIKKNKVSIGHAHWKFEPKYPLF